MEHNTRIKAPLKTKARPNAATFRAGVKKLDLINNTGEKQQGAVVIILSSDSEHSEEEKTTTKSRRKQARYHHQKNQNVAPLEDLNTKPADQQRNGVPKDPRQRRRPLMADSEDEDTPIQSLPPSHSIRNTQKNILPPPSSNAFLPRPFALQQTHDPKATKYHSAHQKATLIDTSESLELDWKSITLQDLLCMAPTGYTKPSRPVHTTHQDAFKKTRPTVRFVNSSPAKNRVLAPHDANAEREMLHEQDDSWKRRSLKDYDKRGDSGFDPIRDPEHEVHRDCDIPLPSVEDGYPY